MQSLDFQPIGHISSCYQEKFGVPRQPGLVTAARSQLTLNNEFNQDCVRGLEDFSHIWLHFIFHQTQHQGWKSMVRPPRLGGNKKVGVFATRSTFRPNPIGLSVVELIDIKIKKSTVVLNLLGCDLVNGTPVLDIKPYLPYADSIVDASGGFAPESPSSDISVIFTPQANEQCLKVSDRLGENIHLLVEQILALGPKPSYQKYEQNKDRIYRMKLYDFDLRWQYCENNKIKVLELNEN